MNMPEDREVLDKLKTLYEELKSYKRLLNVKGRLSSKERLREILVRKVGVLKTIIIELTGKEYISQLGNTYNIWDVALTAHAHRVSSICDTALDFCIDAVNEAIGKLESTPLAELKLQEVSVTQKPKDTTELPVYLFDAMQFHPKVVEASKSCFATINYREAILNAFISLIDYIKEISGLDLDGDDLMNNVFSFNYDKEQRKITKYPIICINELKNRTDRDEQQGFMFLCKGAAAFVRNPKAHKLIVQTDPLPTLEYLAFASMLFKQLDKRVQIRHKEHPIVR